MTGPRAYGPHRPEDAPRMILVGHPHSDDDPERFEPVAPAVLRLRRQINSLAYEAGRA